MMSVRLNPFWCFSGTTASMAGDAVTGAAATLASSASRLKTICSIPSRRLVIRKHFPEEHYADDRPGRKPTPARRVLDAALWILNTGAQWHHEGNQRCGDVKILEQ